MIIDLSNRTLHQLQLMAAKLQNDPSYMAWVINIYQKQEKLSLDKLIKVLNTNEEILARLSLCKRPNTSSNEFRKQVTQISEYTKIDLLLLVKMIRQIESLVTLSSAVDVNSDSVPNSAKLGLAVARDRSPDDFADKRVDDEEENDDVADE